MLVIGKQNDIREQNGVKLCDLMENSQNMLLCPFVLTTPDMNRSSEKGAYYFLLSVIQSCGVLEKDK